MVISAECMWKITTLDWWRLQMSKIFWNGTKKPKKTQLLKLVSWAIFINSSYLINELLYPGIPERMCAVHFITRNGMDKNQNLNYFKLNRR